LSTEALYKCIQSCLRTSEVVSVRVKRGLRKYLEERGVDVSEAVRSYLEELAWRVRLKESLERLDEALREMPPAPPGFAARSVREDRDSH
jgi:hypothetical protein